MVVIHLQLYTYHSVIVCIHLEIISYKINLTFDTNIEYISHYKDAFP